MRFFYRIAQEEQKLEAPLHQRPSTPGLGACLPPNDAVVTRQDDSNNKSDNPVNQLETCKSEVKSVNNSIEMSTVKDSNNRKNLSNDKINSLADNKQITIVDDAKKTTIVSVSTTMAATSSSSSSSLTTTNAIAMLTTVATTTNVSPSTTMCYDSNNKQIKSPIKIMKNPDGRYEVLKNSRANWNDKEQTAAATIMDIKPTSPEFSVVSIGNGQNSNSVKITLKQCSPTSGGTSVKKPKVISNVLLRCGQVEKDSSGTLVIQQLQKDKDTILSPPTQDKQEKQRRKVTFVDQPISEKTSLSSSSATASKTVLKKPVEQQDKKQFLQSIQLTARESVPENITLKSPVRDASETLNNSLQKNNATLKTEELFKKDATVNDEVKEKSNTENIGSNTSNTSNSNVAMSTIAKRLAGVSAGNTRTYTNKGLNDNTDGRSFNSGMSSGMNANSSHSTAKMDVYTFHSSDPPVVPAGAVKRKCPPGVPIVDLKRKRQQIQAQNQGPKKQIISSPNPSPIKRTSLADHVSASKTTSMAGDNYGNVSRVSNVNNAKVSNSPMLSNDTRNLLDGCGLSIPASLSITLTAPKSPGISGQFAELNNPNDSVRKVAALGKVNPSITLNDRSVDPRVLKALKTGQIRMPTPPKIKSSATGTTKQTDRSEMNQQQRMTTKRKKEQESILDLSGSKKMDIHPLRVPQPVTKLKANNKMVGRDNIPGISDQGQVVTLMGGHRYYRAPPGSLTPAAHRVNDCPPLPTPSRTPVYAPTLADVDRTSSNLSSVFPSLQSLYAFSRANLQQFQMDSRLRLPSPRAAEGSENGSSSINNMPGKSHLAAQCAPIKPARSSVAPLAVPINKHQSADKSANISINRTNDVNKPSAFYKNSEGPTSIEETTPRLTVQTRYSSGIENTNKFLSPQSNADDAKNNDQTSVENSRSSNTESKNESIDTGSSTQQQQHHDTASPRVSSTASPSPPPDNNDINTRNESTNNQGDNFSNTSNGGGNNVAAANATSSNTAKTSTDLTSSKSPASPDSSSIAVESSTGKNSTTSTDQEVPTDSQTSDTMKTNDSTANSDNTIDGSVSSVDDKKQFANQSIDAKQLTSEIVQKRLLAVFPSNEWANNPIAAEHLGNFLKSLNATIKTDGHIEELKAEKADQKMTVDNDDTRSLESDTSAKLRKDIVEQS